MRTRNKKKIERKEKRTRDNLLLPQYIRIQ